MKRHLTLSDFLYEIETKLSQMNEVNLSTAIHRVAKICRSAGQSSIDEAKRSPSFPHLQGAVRAALWKTMQLLGNGGGNQVPMGVACVCWAHATLRLPDPQFFAEVAYRCSPHLKMFKNLEVANLIWAFAKLQERGQGATDLFNAAAGEAMARPDDFTVVNLSTLVWAFATSRVKHKSFFKVVARRISDSAREAESQEIANTLWAFATSAVFDKGLFDRMGSEAASKLDSFKAQEAANTAWAYGRSKMYHPGFFEALDRHLRSRAGSHGGLRDFEPQHLSMILGAITTLNPAKGGDDDAKGGDDDRGMDDEADENEEAEAGNGANAADSDDEYNKAKTDMDDYDGDRRGGGAQTSSSGIAPGGSRGQALAIGLICLLVPESVNKVKYFKPEEASRLRAACRRMALLEDDDEPPASITELPDFSSARSVARQFASVSAHLEDHR